MICPNLSIPSIRSEFNSLKNIVGEDFAYFLWNRNQGHPLNKKVITKNKKETVVDNPIYKSFLDQYQGNEAKATFAVAVTFSSKFKKQYPNFDTLNSFIQNKVVHSYITKNGGDLDALAKKVIAKVTQGFKAEAFRPEEIQQVSREMLQQISEEVDNTINKPTGRQLLDAYIWFSNSPLSQYTTFSNMSSIVNEKAFATWTSAAITLYKGSDFSDLYHESFHEFTQRFLTKAEKAALYELIKSRPGSITLNGTEIPYYSLTNRQVEEVLAEGFRSYSLTKSLEVETPEEEIEEPVRSLFERIINFLKNLFTKQTVITPEGTVEETKSPVDELFEKLYLGNLSEYKPSEENIEANKLNRSKSLTLDIIDSQGEKHSIEYSSLEGAEILSAIDYYFNTAVDRMGINASFFNNSELKKKLLPQIYDQVKTSIEAAIENYQTQLTTADPASAEIIEERINSLIPLVYNKDGQDIWKEVVTYHQGFSKGNVLKTVTDNQINDIDEIIDNVPEEESTRNAYQNRSAEQINPLELASPEILELIKSLPDITRNSKGEIVQATGDILGLPRVGDYIDNKNLILNKVSGITNYSKAMSILSAASDLSPQLQYFVDRMPKTEGTLTLAEEALKAQFMQFASMPTVDPINIRVAVESPKAKNAPKKVLSPTLFVENTLSQGALIEFFDQDFIENSARKYRNVDSNNVDLPKFSLKSVLDDYSELSPFTDKTLFNFIYDVFGIDLFNGVSDSVLFNRKGELNFNANPKITPTSLKGLRRMGAWAFNKMILVDKITRSKNEDLISLAPATTGNPAATWTTDISGRLKEAINKLDSKNDLKIFYDKYFKTSTVKNERRNFYETVEGFYNLSNSASYLSIENNLEWSIREWNHLLNTVENINSIEHISQLEGHLSPATNNFIKHSAWFDKMFDYDGNRKYDQNGDPVKLEVYNMAGLQVGSLRGRKTTNLAADGKLIQDFLGFLQDRTVENMRAGAKSSSFATRISGNTTNRTYFAQEDFLQDKKAVIASSVISQMRRYLDFEVSRMFDDRSKSNAKEVRGSEFIIFKEIFPEELQQEVKDLVAQADSKESLLDAVGDMFAVGRNTRYSDFVESINNHFNNQLIIFRSTMVETISQGKATDFTREFNKLRYKEGGYTLPEIDALLLFYLTNYNVHQIEYIHTIVGDPSNFNVKGGNWRELFKRLGGSISPGKQPHIDDQTLSSWNLKYPRELEKIQTGSSREYDYNFNYTQFKDIVSFTDEQRTRLEAEIKQGFIDWKLSLLPKNASKVKKAEAIKAAEAEIQENLNDMFTQDKEADAQAYANLDFIRFYLNSVGEFSDLEDAYQHEVKVLAAIKDYRSGKGTKQQVLDLIAQANKGILTSLKLGYYGSPANDNKYVSMGKYSVFNLLPSAVFDTDLEDLMFDMFDKGVDLATFDSGNKMSLPIQSTDFYGTSGEGANQVLKINKIKQENVVSFPITGLRRQQYIAPKFKNEATLSTQMVKLLFGDFYVDGQINPDFAPIADKMNNLQQAFIDMVQNVVNAEKAKIYNQIEAEVDSEGNIQSFSAPAFKNWLFKEFDKKDIPSSVYLYIDTINESTFSRSLDGSAQRNLIEGVISSALSKRVLRPKMFGEAYIQLASSGFNNLGTRFTKPTKDQVAQYGTSGLRDYRIESGKTQPADIKVSFNPKKHSALLNLEFEGKPIQTLDRLNQALLDDAWVAENSAKITMVGVRIPVQGFNSMEYFRIRQFLPTSAGPVIIVPPSIVTKSGSDFDIDKLFMYEPKLDEDGNIIDDAVVDSPNFSKDMLNSIRERAINLQSKKEIKALLNNTGAYFVKGLYEQDIKNLKGVLYDLSTRKASYDDPLVEGAHLRIKLLIARIEELKKQNPTLTQTLDSLKSINEDLNTLQAYTPNNIKNISSNRMINVISEVLSEPSLYSRFTKPNKNTILPPIAERYLELKGKGGAITASYMFSPMASLSIFNENTLGKKSLGVDAKVNALHKLFQQTGLKMTQSFLVNNYRLKSNKDKNGSIILGGYLDADSINLISDVINEFINGHVDIEKEDWINYFNADRSRTPLILQMVLNGTPIEDAILLVNQPIIQHYLRSSNVGDIAASLDVKGTGIKKYIIEGIKALKMEEQVLEVVDGKVDMDKTIENILNDSYFSKHLDNFNSTDYPPYVTNSRKAYNEILEAGKKEDIKAQRALAAQIAFLTQFGIVKEQNKSLLELTSNIDFNTNSYRTITDFFSVVSTINSARENFNDEAINQILTNSVVAPFNITQDAITISKNVFDVLSLDTIQSSIEEFLEDNYIVSKDRAIKETNKILNGFMHLLIQKYGVDKTSGLNTQYGRNSGFLDKKSATNLKSKYISLFKDNKKEDLRSFGRSNMFLKNFTTIDIKGTDMFYIGMRTNEKDPDTIDAVQKAYMDGLNHPNPEVSKFFKDVANATIVSQGFNVKYRSIQPYLPIQSYIDVIVGLSSNLKDIKNASIENPEGDSQINNLLRSHFKEVTVSLYSTKNQTELNKYFPTYSQAKVVAEDIEDPADTLPGDNEEYTNPDQDLYDDDIDNYYESDSIRGPVQESTDVNIPRKSKTTNQTDAETVKCSTKGAK